MAEEAGSKANQAVWVNWIGNSFSVLGKAQEAITKYQLSLKFAKEAGNRRGEGIALSNLGDRYAALGDVRRAIEYYEQALVIAREIDDKRIEGAILGNLGDSYADLGNINKAIEFDEQALVIARGIGDRRGEGADLGNLGNDYANLGNVNKAIEFAEQALGVCRETGDRKGESIALENLGQRFLSLDENQKAKESYLQAVQIADEISFPPVQQNARWGLAQVYFFQNDLVNARVTIEAALQYDVPENNHNASALHGIIALRQGERETAQEAFMKSIAQADDILAKTPEYYSALDAKGLSICGLLICDLRLKIDGRGNPSGQTETPDESRRVAPTVNDAIETFKKARKIAPHAGVVKSVLRLFDELVKCDEAGILKDVRKAAEGVE